MVRYIRREVKILIFQNDWIMRQIEMLIQFIVRTLFGRDSMEYELSDPEERSDTDALFIKINRLIEKNSFSEAEDVLFESYIPDNESYIRLGIDFYQRLNRVDRETLEKNNFSQEEIYEGIRDFLKLCGISFPEI